VHRRRTGQAGGATQSRKKTLAELQTNQRGGHDGRPDAAGRATEAPDRSEPATDAAAGTQPATDPAASTQPATDPAAGTQPATDPAASTQPATDPAAGTQPATDPAAGTQPATDPAASTQPATEAPERDGQDTKAPHPAEPGAAAPSEPAGAAGRGATRGATFGQDVRRVGAALAPRELWRNHRLFTIVAAVSLLPRILAALSFRPALLSSDSFLYMQEATKVRLGDIRPSGYSAFLKIFEGLPHALLLVTTVQHLMGIAIGAIVYGLLRYWGLPAWGATLAALPTLFDSREIALESYILPDTLYCLVIIVAVALLLTKRRPQTWQCVAAGLLMAYASVVRANGLPLAILVALFLLIRKVGWRAFAAGAVAFLLPLLAYASVFSAEYGTTPVGPTGFTMELTDGIFLWSRVTSFANCAVIKPPAKLRPLCPNLEKSVTVPAKTPSWSLHYLLSEPGPANYLWASDVWWRHDGSHHGITEYNNKLGMQFALDAIKAQPLDYLKVVTRDTLLTFLATDRPQGNNYMTFTTTPRIAALPSYYAHDMKAYAGTTSNTHAVQPYAFFMLLYQQPVYFSGIVYLAVVIGGLIGVLRRWRRWGGMPALPWALAAASILLPAVLTQAYYRYAIMAIPLACLALGLCFVRQRRSPAAPAEQPGNLDGGPATVADAS
jgi:hypothetical protein